jgi:hypothetical protein
MDSSTLICSSKLSYFILASLSSFGVCSFESAL